MNVFNRVLGLLLGLTLLGAGALAVVETVLAAIDRPPWLVQRQDWHGFLLGLTWEDRWLVLTGTLVLLAGIALLAVQIVPGTPSRLPLTQDDPDRRAAIDGRGMQELLRRWAAQDEDVLGANARVRRRTARVTVNAPPDADASDLRTRVRETLRNRIDDLHLEKPLRPKVQVRRTKERVR